MFLLSYYLVTVMHGNSCNHESKLEFVIFWEDMKCTTNSDIIPQIFLLSSPICKFHSEYQISASQREDPAWEHRVIQVHRLKCLWYLKCWEIILTRSSFIFIRYSTHANWALTYRAGEKIYNIEPDWMAVKYLQFLIESPLGLQKALGVVWNTGQFHVLDLMVVEVLLA